MAAALDVYTYGGGAALYEVFNAVATIMGSGDYLVLIRLFGVIALLWVVFTIAFSQKMIEIRWLFMFTLMFFIFFTPKETVIIHDKFDPGATRVVANVPEGLARLAWLSSGIGEGLLRMSEAVFTLPGDLNYSKNGMVFGSKVLNAINNAQFDDPLLRQNLNTYTKQCVYYNMAYGFYSTRDLMTSNNLLDLALSTTHNSHIRGMFYIDSSGNRTFKTCAQGAGQLRTDITPQVDGMLGRFANAIFSNNSKTDAAKKADLLAALPLSYTYIAGITTNASDMLTQTALANYFRDSGPTIAAMTDSAAMATAMAETTAARQQRSSYRVMGEMAERNLPMMRTVFEVLVYGSFFVVFLLLLMPMSVSGKALVTYIKVLVWLQLWPILYSILNLVMVLYSASSTQGAVDASLGVTSMAGLAGMVEVNTDLAIMAGYLGLSIPLIAWQLLNAGGHGMSQLAAGLFAPANQAANQAAGEVARGNISTGNAQMGNQSFFQQSMGPNRNVGSSFDDGAVKNSYSEVNGGRQSSQANMSDMGVNVAQSETLARNVSAARSQAEVHEQTQAASLTQAKANESTAAHEFVETASSSSDANLRQEVSEIVGDSSTFQTSQDVVEQFAEKHGVSDEVATGVMAAMNAGIKADSSGSLLGWLAEKGSGMSVSGQVMAELKGTSNSKVQDMFEDAETSKYAESYSNAVNKEERLADVASQSWNDSASQQAADKLSYANKETLTAQEQWSAAHKQSEQLQETEAFVNNESKDVRTNLNQELENFLVDNNIDAGVDDVGLRAKAANSEAFAEHVMATQGINMDLDGDGKVGVWKEEMSNLANASLDTGAPDDITPPPNFAQDASETAGLTPGELNQNGVAGEVQQTLEVAEQNANVNQQVLSDGKAKVENAADNIEMNVNNQSIDTNQRAINNAVDAVVDVAGDAGRGALNMIGGVHFSEHDKPGTGVGGLQATRNTSLGGVLEAEPRTLGQREGDVSYRKKEAEDETTSSNVPLGPPLMLLSSGNPASSEVNTNSETPATSEPQGETGGYNAVGGEPTPSNVQAGDSGQQGEVNTNNVAPDAGTDTSSKEVVQAEPTSNVDNTGSASTTSASIQESNSGDVPATPGATVSGGEQ